jgi:ATP-dependent Clp protease protease subunit
MDKSSRRWKKETKMTNKNRPSEPRPIQVVDGVTEPYARFWAWSPRNETEGQDAELKFYGYISEYSWYEDDITPRKFAEDLAKYGAGKPITVRIHSGGGDIFAASAIRSMLTEYEGHITARIEGLCASATVGVAMAADEIKMQDTAYMMIHNPIYSFFWAALNANDMRKFADELDVFKSGILSAYVTRTGMGSDELSDLMDAETWMDAEKAAELGFVDSVITGGKPAEPNQSVTNTLKTAVNTPPALLNVSSAPEPTADADELKKQAERLQEKTSSILQKE